MKKKKAKATKKVRRIEKSKPAAKKMKELTEFCKKCGSIMLPIKKGSRVMMKCRSCGYQTKENAKDIRISENISGRRKKVIVLEKDETMLPITDKICPECEQKKAYWWMQQTRNSDEPPTQFFRCVKCKHVWREYK